MNFYSVNVIETEVNCNKCHNEIITYYPSKCVICENNFCSKCVKECSLCKNCYCDKCVKLYKFKKNVCGSCKKPNNNCNLL